AYYYLFVSFDRCCQGVDSTYKVMVGRSRGVTGPYLDRQGVPLREGGGSMMLESHGRVRGPGHNAVLQDGARTWFVHHFYDAEFHGARTLQIRPLRWDTTTGHWSVSRSPVLRLAPIDRRLTRFPCAGEISSWRIRLDG